MTVWRRLALGLWSGWLVAQGAVFAPLAFAVLAERTTAGRFAAAGFTTVAYGSLGFGLVCYLLRPRTVGRQGRALLLALAPGALLLASHVALSPLIAGHGPYFAAAHGAGTLIYGVATLLVLGMWWQDERRSLR